MKLNIDLNSLTEEQRLMIDRLGIEAFTALVKYYGGQTVYIPKADAFIRLERDERIRNEFNGYNYKFLCAKYNLSERTIRAITSERNTALKNIEGQLTWEDIEVKK